MPAQGELNDWQPPQRATTSIKIVNCMVRIAFSRKAGEPISANRWQCNNPEITLIATKSFDGEGEPAIQV